MSLATICNRNVVYIDQDAGIVEVAQLMRERHVGSVIVVDGAGKPIGIITDRDLVIEVIANEVSAEALLLKDIMTPEPVILQESADTEAALKLLRDHGVRRAPVVDAEGLLSGIVSMDDVLQHLSQELNELVSLIDNEQQQESLVRERP